MSTTILKIIAVISMLIDHIGFFFPSMPIVFRWIGRIKLPIFIFCLVWGFEYTSDIKKYISRMYISSVLMGILNYLLGSLPLKNSRFMDMNIFRVLFIILVVVWLYDNWVKHHPKRYVYISVFLAWQIISAAVLLLAFWLDMGSDLIIEQVLSALLGSIYLLEGGILYVIFGLSLYITKENKLYLSITTFVFSILYTLLFYLNILPRALGKLGRMGFRDLSELLEIPIWFLFNYMPLGIKDYSLIHDIYFWGMIFALPFMVLYNGEKGKGYKCFFYVFYPLHIVVLYIISNLNIFA